MMKARQGDGSQALSWTMKRFLEPASRVNKQLLQNKFSMINMIIILSDIHSNAPVKID